MKRAIVIAFALIILSGWGSSSGFEALSFDVRMDGNEPIVEWSAKSEEGLLFYEVHVVTPYTTRKYKFDKQGAGYVYVYRDTELYKGAGELVQYQVHAHLDSETKPVVLVGSDDLEYTPTAVRRTWGSIKAMFQ